MCTWPGHVCDSILEVIQLQPPSENYGFSLSTWLSLAVKTPGSAGCEWGTVRTICYDGETMLAMWPKRKLVVCLLSISAKKSFIRIYGQERILSESSLLRVFVFADLMGEVQIPLNDAWWLLEKANICVEAFLTYLTLYRRMSISKNFHRNVKQG